jgi:CRP/FNR family transcriptional activator FtrB
MRSEDLKAVRALPLFSTMEEATFERMMPASFLQRFPTGVELIREGETADFLHIVVEGSVELFATGNGRETTVAVFRPVTAFILAAVLKDMIYLMSARTLQESRILMIPSELLLQAMEKDTAFAKAMIDELARGFRTMVKAVKNQKLRTGAERLANYLIHHEAAQGGRGFVKLEYEKRLLASLLGITPENLSRAFRSLGAYGVTVDGSTIRLGDKPALKRFAKPTPLIDTPET